MSFQLTPSKRPSERNHTETNGRGKMQKLGSQNQSSGFVLRVLCPTTKIGSVIGKGGGIISQMRQETGARIRVEEPIPGCDERVIFIVSPDKESEDGSNQRQQQQPPPPPPQQQQQQQQTDADGNDDNGEIKTEDEHEDREEKEQSNPIDDSELEKEKETPSAVQKALLLVFERMTEGEVEKDGGEDEEGDKSAAFVVRLLVISSQIGCLLGKAGSVIKKMASESGAQIRILPRDKLPPPAAPSDELVQISGGADAVKKALISVSQQLLENPRRDQLSVSAYPSGPSSHSVGRPPYRQDAHSQSHRPFHGEGLPYSAGFHDGEAARMLPPHNFLTYRLWCPHDKIGGVIGKGGTVVKAIQHETGCEIKVLDGGVDSEDRIVVISGPAHPDDRISAAQDAVLRVQSRIFRASPESQEKTVTAKLLVSSNQIGCLLGRGGSIIAEMRKSTGAYIRILGKDQLPKGALESEEVVQMNGELEAVQEALIQITTKLRDHFFRDAFPSMNYPSNPAFLDQIPPFPPYMGRRDFSPSSMYSNPVPPPFNAFDSVTGLPSHGGFHPHDERPPFMQNFQGQGIPPISERMQSSAGWGPQGPIEGGGPLGLSDYVGPPPRRIGGFGGVNHQAIITSTTIEVVVPRSVVPAIYGEDGGCLRQIREISDAKVTITESKPGATETVIIISGTPEQTNAAQSLIQAFVTIETKST